MRDGSDAIADWPILNALVNMAAGATWVSVHHGGGVGIGNSIHAGMVVVADGTDDAAERLERVLTTDPARASCATPTPATTRRSTLPREHGLDLPARTLTAPSSRARRADGCSIRDLAQVASPGGPRARRCAAAALGDARRDRGRRTSSATDGAIAAVGRDARPRPARRRRRGARRPRALRDPGPRRLPHARGFAGDRVEEFALRAAGASYEELHAAGGGILSTVRATRAAGEDGLRAAVARHRGWMLRAGTTTFEGKSGYGLDRETELASLRAIRAAGGDPDLARRPRGSARVRRRRRLPRLRARRGAARGRGGSPRPPTSSSSAAPSTRRRRAATSRPAALPGSRCACTATSSPRRARSRSRSSSARARSTTSRRPAPTASQRWRRATSPACCCPASALFLGRPMPPARALVDAGAAVALATDFNPGSAFCESLPLVCSLAATQLQLSPGGGAGGLHGQRGARARPRRPVGRLAPGYAPTSSCSTRPTGATSPTTSAETWSPRSSRTAPSPGRRGIMSPWRRRSSAAASRSRSGTSTRTSTSTTREARSTPRRPRSARQDRARRRPREPRRRSRRCAAAARSSRPRCGARCKRGLIFSPLMFFAVFLLGPTLSTRAEGRRRRSC